MSLYQFNSYLDEIPEIEKIFSGSKTSKKETITTEELIKMAEQKGIKTPKKF